MSTYRLLAARTELLRTRGTVHQARRARQRVDSAGDADDPRATQRRQHGHRMTSVVAGQPGSQLVGGRDAANGIASGLRAPRARPVQVHFCTIGRRAEKISILSLLFLWIYRLLLTQSHTCFRGVLACACVPLCGHVRPLGYNRYRQ